jgi:hypothetical protein
MSDKNLVIPLTIIRQFVLAAGINHNNKSNLETLARIYVEIVGGLAKTSIAKSDKQKLRTDDVIIASHNFRFKPFFDKSDLEQRPDLCAKSYKNNDVAHHRALRNCVFARPGTFKRVVRTLMKHLGRTQVKVSSTALAAMHKTTEAIFRSFLNQTVQLMRKERISMERADLIRQIISNSYTTFKSKGNKVMSVARLLTTKHKMSDTTCDKLIGLINDLKKQMMVLQNKIKESKQNSLNTTATQTDNFNSALESSATTTSSSRSSDSDSGDSDGNKNIHDTTTTGTQSDMTSNDVDELENESAQYDNMNNQVKAKNLLLDQRGSRIISNLQNQLTRNVPVVDSQTQTSETQTETSDTQTDDFNSESESSNTIMTSSVPSDSDGDSNGNVNIHGTTTIGTQSDMTSDHVDELENELVHQKVRNMNDQVRAKNDLLDQELDALTERMKRNADTMSNLQNQELETVSERVRGLNQRQKLLDEGNQIISNLQNQLTQKAPSVDSETQTSDTQSQTSDTQPSDSQTQTSDTQTETSDTQTQTSDTQTQTDSGDQVERRDSGYEEQSDQATMERWLAIKKDSPEDIKRAAFGNLDVYNPFDPAARFTDSFHKRIIKETEPQSNNSNSLPHPLEHQSAQYNEQILLDNIKSLSYQNAQLQRSLQEQQRDKELYQKMYEILLENKPITSSESEAQSEAEEGNSEDEDSEVEDGAQYYSSESSSESESDSDFDSDEQSMSNPLYVLDSSDNPLYASSSFVSPNAIDVSDMTLPERRSTNSESSGSEISDSSSVLSNNSDTTFTDWKKNKRVKDLLSSYKSIKILTITYGTVCSNIEMIRNKLKSINYDSSD